MRISTGEIATPVASMEGIPVQTSLGEPHCCVAMHVRLIAIVLFATIFRVVRYARVAASEGDRLARAGE